MARDRGTGGDAATAAAQEVRRQLKEAMVARDSEDVEPLRVAVERAAEVGLEPSEVEAARQVLERLESEFQPLTFTDIPRPEMERLQRSSLQKEIVEILMRCMGLSLEGGMQSEILAEFHYHNFMFCRKHRFCPEKASTFLSIMKTLHMRAVVEEKLSESEARELFERLMTRHGRQLPPFSVAAFSLEDLLVAKEYASRSFFRHYSMHVFVNTRRQDLSVRTLTENVTPKIPQGTELHTRFELDPREVPELQDLFVDPEAEAAAERDEQEAAAAAEAAAAESAAAAAGGQSDGASRSPAHGSKAEVDAAIDAALKAHLPALDQRLNKLPG